MDRPARRFQEFQAGGYYCQALGARQSDVETVRAEQEFDVAGQAFGIRGSHRNKNDWCFLALEFIDRPDSGSGGQNLIALMLTGQPGSPHSECVVGRPGRVVPLARPGARQPVLVVYAPSIASDRSLSRWAHQSANVNVVLPQLAAEDPAALGYHEASGGILQIRGSGNEQ